MKKEVLFASGVLVTTLAGASAQAGYLADSACAILKTKIGLHLPAGACDDGPATTETPISTPSTPPPTVVTPSTPKPPTSLVEQKYSGPARTLEIAAGQSLKSANEKLFSQYCIANGGADSASVPQPNYKDKEVLRAANILSQVAKVNFYFYGDILRIYKAQAPRPDLSFGNGIALTDDAHYFLVQTCGEFRDRAEMVRGKIRWVNNMVLLPNVKQSPEIKVNENIWQQLSAESYTKYIDVSRQVFSMKASQAAANQTLSADLHSDAQEPVDAFSVCETKYLVANYVAKDSELSSLSQYEAGLAKYKSQCSEDDNNSIYDFRGDSNFKQYSPESNAMLWHAISIARFCKSPTESNGKSSEITNEVCEAYFKAPFMSRYNAARSGLGAWLNYSEAESKNFQNQGLNVTVMPTFDVTKLGRVSFKMKLSDGSLTNPNDSLESGDLGFNKRFGIGESNPDLKTAFERLRNAVNRHTNWYKSSYDDQLGHEKSLRDQAYSPFVASSYDMSASNAFTECGYTVKCNGDGRKAWMLVFKIKKENWYNTRSLAKNQKINFDRMWIDETTFGTDSLADSEKAFDRLGTALEDELETIIYLHNLEAGAGIPGYSDVLVELK